MKFLAAVLSFAVMVTPVVGNGVNQTVNNWAGRGSIIQDATVYLNSDSKVFGRKRTQKGVAIFEPRGPKEKETHDEHQRQRALKIAEQRQLQGVAFAKQPAKISDGGTEEFIISGLLGAERASLVFSSDDDDVIDPVDLMDFLAKETGVATISLELHNHDEVKNYSVKVTYSIGGVAGEAQGSPFKYGLSALARDRDGNGNIVTNSANRNGNSYKGEGEYTNGGQIVGATGRIYFSSYGVDYACTGTVIRDNKSGRSLVLTAAHCVFDDIDFNWGSNVIFIPNRDSVDLESTDMTGDDIHRHCGLDVCGCWTLSGGVVHDMWADTPWPDRLMYDYGFYIVDDVGDHQGTSCGSDALDEAIDELDFKVGVDIGADNIHAFGYSLEHNPDFRECADDTSYNQPTDSLDTYWLPGCGLTGGASGGPWMGNFDSSSGKGNVVSVNSWSYSDVPGMGGPIIDASAARCLVNAAREIDFESLMDLPDGDEGVFVNCYDRPCVPDDESTGRRLRTTGKEKDRRHRVLCEHKESP